MQEEPELLFCTMRDGFDELDMEEPATVDLECRFSDGQKFVAVSIDAKFPKLAQKINAFLNSETKLNER